MGLNFDVMFMFITMKEAIKYTWVTLLLAFVPFGVGLVLGTLIALLRLYRVKVLGRLMQLYVVVNKGIPIVLQIFIIYFAVILSFDIVAKALDCSVRSKDINMIFIAIAALTFFAAANISETVRGALMTVSVGQYEAAYSVGLTRSQALRRIVLPQALPVAVPMLCSNLIGLVKGSSLVFMISVTDLMNAALIPANTNYKYLEAYIAAAIVYWVLNVIIEKGSFWLERRLSTHKREVLF